VTGFVADVEGQQEQAASCEDAMHFGEGGDQRGFGDVHDRIEGGDAGEGIAGQIEREHVAFAEVHAGIEAPSMDQHGGREVEAEDGRAGVVEIARDVAGTAAHVADYAASGCGGGETIEQLAVEGLIAQFVENPAGVLIGDAVVAVANGLRGTIRH
jgi:hypothetical protein